MPSPSNAMPIVTAVEVEVGSYSEYLARAVVREREADVDWSTGSGGPMSLHAVRVDSPTILYRGKIRQGRAEETDKIVDVRGIDDVGTCSAVLLEGDKKRVLCGRWLQRNGNAEVFWFNAPVTLTEVTTSFLEDLSKVPGTATYDGASLSLVWEETDAESPYQFVGRAKNGEDFSGGVVADGEDCGRIEGQLLRAGPGVQFIGQWKAPAGLFAVRVLFKRLTAAEVIPYVVQPARKAKAIKRRAKST